MDDARRNRILGHLLVWGGAALIYLALVYPLARALALDLQALLENTSQDYSPNQPAPWFADRAWIPQGKALILAGAAPLVLLFLGTLGYRLLPWRVVVANPVRGLARPWRWLLGAAVLGLFAAASLPLALAGSVWLQVEAYWWIQWYINVDMVLEQLREVAPPAVLPGMLLAGAWCTWGCLRRPRLDRRPLWARLLKIALALAALPVLAPLIGASLVGAVHAGRVLASPGPGVFEERCAGCHDLTLPLYYVKTPAEWARTVETQIKVEGVRLDADQRQEVLGFLVGMRSFSDAWTFRTRCQRCHGDVGPDRSPEDWSATVDRLARWSPYYYRPDVKAQLMRHLERTRSRPDARTAADDKAHEAAWRTGKFCSRCHSFSRGRARNLSMSDERIRKLFQRMNGKLARPVSSAELDRLRAPYRRLMSNPALLRRLFPHDQPVEDGWIKW